MNEFLVVIKHKTGEIIYRDFHTYEAADGWYVISRQNTNIEWIEFLRSTAEGMLRLGFFIPAPPFDPNRPGHRLMADRRARRKAMGL